MKNVLVNGRSGRASCHRIITGLREFYKDGDVIPWEDLEYFIEQLCGLDWRTKMKYATSLVKLKFLEPIGPRRRIIIRKPGRMGHVRTYDRLGAWEAYKFGRRAPRRYQETLNPKYVVPPSPSPLLKKMKGVEENYVCVVVGGEVGGSRAEGGEGENRRKEEKKGQRTHILLSQENLRTTPKTREAKTSLVQKNRSFSGDIENDAELRDRTRVRNGVIWIVDWDVPLTKNRFRFYRALRKLKKELGLHDSMSTKSVLITKDEESAFRVYDLALMFADKVHIYEAREVGTRVPIQGGSQHGSA